MKSLINKIKIDMYERVAFRCYNLSKFEKAEHYFRKILEIEPDRIGIAYNLGAVCFAMGNLEEAEKLLSEERQRSGNNYEICKSLAEIGWLKEDRHSALTHLKSTLGHAEADCDKKFISMKIDLCKDDETFMEAISAIDDFKEADKHMAYREYDEAEKLYYSALEKDPSNFLAWINIGVIAMNIRMDYDKAEEAFSKAHEMSDLDVISKNMEKLQKMRRKTGR